MLSQKKEIITKVNIDFYYLSSHLMVIYTIHFGARGIFSADLWLLFLGGGGRKVAVATLKRVRKGYAELQFFRFGKRENG